MFYWTFVLLKPILESFCTLKTSHFINISITFLKFEHMTNLFVFCLEHQPDMIGSAVFFSDENCTQQKKELGTMVRSIVLDSCYYDHFAQSYVGFTCNKNSFFFLCVIHLKVVREGIHQIFEFVILCGKRNLNFSIGCTMTNLW